jgi:hypothetical protein
MLVRGGVSTRPEPRGVTASLRLRLPERIVRMAEFGLRHQPAEEAGCRDAGSWWRRVERELESVVFAHIPAAAERVALYLDPDALEVVVEYALPA